MLPLTPRRRDRVRVLLAMSLASLAMLRLAPTAHAADDPRAARCVAAYEEGQRERREGKLTAAQSSLRECKDTCPTRFSRDCQRWLSEIDETIPTVRFHVLDDRGRKVEYARILLDGVLLRNEIPDEPVPVDPGAHVFRIERIGSTPVDVKVTLKAGEREHPVDASIVPPSAVDPDLAIGPRVREGNPHESGNRPVAYAFGITGVAAIALSGVLAVKGHFDRSSLEDECNHQCAPSRGDSIRTLWWVSAASAGVGLISLGIAYWQWPRIIQPANARLSFVPLAGGLAVRAEFQ